MNVPNALVVTKGSHTDVQELTARFQQRVEMRVLYGKQLAMRADGRPLPGFIIDEAHMLSNSAFNALLKTLEPPSRVVLYFATTTEAHSTSITIVSRCYSILGM